MDPVITPIIVSTLIAIGVSATTAAVIAPIATSLILTAVSAGIYYALSPSAPRPPKPDDGKVAIQQPIPPAIYAVGQVRLSGAVVCNEAASGDFYYAAALTNHRIASFERFFLQDDEVTVDGSGSVTPVDPDLVDGRYTSVTLLKRLGVVPETPFAQFVSGLGPPIWTSNHRGDGCSQLAIIAGGVKPEKFTKRYPNAKPQPSAVVKAALLYDPRDADQDPDDDTTWLWSDNIVLQILWHQCFCEAGPRRDYATAVLPVVDQWKACADIADEDVDLSATAAEYLGLSGGTEKRYVGGGWFTSENDPKAVLALMLGACDGWFVERGDGTIWLEVGKLPDEDGVIVLTDDDITGFYFQTDVADEEVINRWIVKFNSPPHLYIETEADPWDDEDDQVARGRVREQTLDLAWLQSYTSARRVAKREKFRQTQKLRGSLELKLSGINAMYSRWIRIQSNLIPRFSDTLIENRMSRFSMASGGIHLEFVATGDGIEDWNSELDDEGLPPPVPDQETVALPPAPENADAYAELYQVNSSTVGTRLVVSFDAMGRSDLDFVIRWRESAGPGVWHYETHREDPTVNGSRWELRTGVVPGDTDLQVEIATLRGTQQSEWSSTITVNSSTDLYPALMFGNVLNSEYVAAIL